MAKGKVKNKKWSRPNKVFIKRLEVINSFTYGFILVNSHSLEFLLHWFPCSTHTQHNPSPNLVPHFPFNLKGDLILLFLTCYYNDRFQNFPLNEGKEKKCKTNMYLVYHQFPCMIFFSLSGNFVRVNHTVPCITSTPHICHHKKPTVHLWKKMLMN